jgi:hypothetical protein
MMMMVIIIIISKKRMANLKLIDIQIVSPDTSTVYSELCWLTGLRNLEAAGLSLYTCALKYSRVLANILLVPKANNKIIHNVASYVNWIYVK